MIMLSDSELSVILCSLKLNRMNIRSNGYRYDLRVLSDDTLKTIEKFEELEERLENEYGYLLESE